MEQYSLLTLSTVQTVAGKVIRDLKNGGRRETRNGIELCKSLTKQPRQKDFWSMIQEFTNQSGAHYDALLHRAAASVREESLKTLAVNLGCIAFSGAGLEKQDWWMQRIRLTKDAETEVEQWNTQGVFVFLVELEKPAAANHLAALAARHARCIFVLLIRGGAPDLSFLSQAAQYDNVCFLVEQKALGAAETLRQARSLFGVLRDYAQVQSLDCEKRALMQWAEQGCVVAAYESAGKAAPGEESGELYRKMVAVRLAGALEIFLCDLQRDPTILLEMVKKQRPLPGRTPEEEKHGNGF